MKILRTAITLLLMGTVLSSWAQAWSKKAAQAVFTLKTFKADGTLLGSANGVFVSENGEAVSSFAPFRGPTGLWSSTLRARNGPWRR